MDGARTDTSTTRVPATARGLVLDGGRREEEVLFDSQVVDFFITAAEMLAVPKSVAAIYGIVFASPQPMSFADIASRLDISKGSISQGLRVLREVGALKEVSSASDRVELFTPDLELRQLVGRFLERRLDKQLNEGSTRLAMLSTSSYLASDEAVVLRRRFKSLSGWHRKAQALLPFVRSFLRITGKTGSSL